MSAFASTPYNVAVGGTDFGDTLAGTNSTYWSNTNSSDIRVRTVLHPRNSLERFLRQRANCGVGILGLAQ